MKVDLVYLIKGKAGKYNQKLISEIASKFNEEDVIEDRLPSHITLKRPFKIRDIKKLEKSLKEFIAKHKSPDIEIKGFDNFRKSVIFLKPKLSKSAVKFQKELLNALKKEGVMPDKLDIPFKPHATVAHVSDDKAFEKIWNYLNELETPKFKLKLDNITILKEEKENKPWKVHKEFKIR